MRATLASLALLAASLGANAAAPPSSYAGQQQRDIKALSSDEIDGYLSGSGMGLAKAAELNGLAGPRHVLDLAGELALTPAQRSQTQELFDRMNSEAVLAGRALVDKERELDRLFATRYAEPVVLEKLLSEIGALQARLRAVHLKAHLAQVDILTPVQNARYGELRGYAKSAGRSGHSGHQGGAHKH